MKPYYEDASVRLYHGDCLDVLRADILGYDYRLGYSPPRFPDASADSVVTDPPYGLEFMGKDWDSFGKDAWRNSAGMTVTGYTDGGKRIARPSYGGGDSANPTCATCGGRKRGAKKCACASPEWRVKGKPLDQRNNNAAQMRAFGDWCEQWTAECLRVLKPGGHMLAFGGTRTWHRLACAVEDAGFEVRDSIAWLYGSGFPKSLDVSKAIDKAAGAEREVVGPSLRHVSGKPEQRTEGLNGSGTFAESVGMGSFITAPATPDAERWQGWGTALKPAFEPVVVARKPLSGTVAANVLEHGTGALNIDATRVGEGGQLKWAKPRDMGYHGGTDSGPVGATTNPAGRWPTNVVLDDTQDAVLDEQSGESSSNVRGATGGEMFGNRKSVAQSGGTIADTTDRGHTDTGGASRFFPTFRYEAKAPASERPKVNGTAHPTVKPLDFMRWLVRLVTPPGGTVLEPFAGSGTTVEACIVEGFHCLAIEREADYLPLIAQRINRRRDPIAYMKAAGEDAGLLGLDFGEVS